MDGSEHTIPAVERAIAAMDVIARQHQTSITQITKELGIPRSTVYRLLNSLTKSSMVLRDASGNYRLGPRLLRLARSVDIGADLVSVARPFLEDLSKRVEMTAKLSVVDGDDAMVVAVVEAQQTYTVSTQVGRRFPLHAGAASKALLAHAPEDLTARLLARPLSQLTPFTISDPDKLNADLMKVRSTGLATDQQEHALGVSAVAAPVFDVTGACVAAVSIPFLSSLPQSEIDRLAGHVMSTAAALTDALGGVTTTPAPEAN